MTEFLNKDNTIYVEFLYGSFNEEVKYCTMPIKETGVIDVEKAMERDKNIMKLELLTRVPIVDEYDELLGRVYSNNYNYFYRICFRTHNGGYSYGAIVIDEVGIIVNVIPPHYTNIVLSDKGFIYAIKAYSYTDIYSKNATPQLLNVNMIKTQSILIMSNIDIINEAWNNKVDFILDVNFAKNCDLKLEEHTFLIDKQTGELDCSDYVAKDNAQILFCTEESCPVLRR